MDGGWVMHGEKCKFVQNFDPEGKVPLGRSMFRLGDNIKINPKDMRC
jgi:hypothetical protein